MALHPIEKAKRHLLGIEIPRDELALRIACPCLQMHPAPGTDAKQALDALDAQGVAPGMTCGMGETFRRAADAAVLYFHERINAGRAPH